MQKNTNWFEIKVYDELDSCLKEKMEELNKNSSYFQKKKKTLEEKKEHFDKYCSESDIVKWIFAFENEDIIGRAVIFKREIQFQDQKITLGGIGKVKVRNDKRRKGVATELLKRTKKELKYLNCDIAHLRTNISFLIPFYNRFGFIVLDRPYTYLGQSGKRYFSEDGMIVPVNSTKLFQAILKDKEPLDIGIGNW